jgi:20S proteasome subunit beta 3
MCEALWKPDLEADDLFEVASQALMSAMNRDALSGINHFHKQQNGFV